MLCVLEQTIKRGAEMSREILFRGKRKDNGEWVEGYCVVIAKCYYIFTGKLVIAKNATNFEYYSVSPETVGQFTGLTDKNGTKIFEDDVVIISSRSIDEEDGIALIEWDEDDARFIFAWGNLVAGFDDFYSYEIEVIGNIHDNPELMEEEEVQNG